MPLWKDIITRLLVIKFRPKARCQTVGLMKLLDRKSNWVVPSLSCNLQTFIGSSFKISLIRKRIYYTERSILLDILVKRYISLWKDIITRILIIKFRPKTRCQSVRLMKWSDRKGNWGHSSVSYNLQTFIGSSFKICLSWKKCRSIWISYEWCHFALMELLRLSDVLVNRSFCWADISRVQLKFNWTVGERLLASDQEAVRECRLILLKGQRTFF